MGFIGPWVGELLYIIKCGIILSGDQSEVIKKYTNFIMSKEIM